MNRRQLAIAGVAGAALLLAGMALLGMRDAARPAATVATPPAATAVLVRMHAPVIGPASAPVTVVEFFDPACEACRAFYPYVKEILARHPGQVRLMLRYTPFHGAISLEGVRILEAARAQGVFEAVLEKLLVAQEQWASHAAPSSDRAWALAAEAGLDLPAARAHTATGAADRIVEQDLSDARTVQIGGTPTFFVNGERLAEPVPRVLLEMVQTALAD